MMKKNFTKSFELWQLKAKLRVFFAGLIVVMVTHYVIKMTTTCSPMIGHLCDTYTILQHHLVKSGGMDSSNYDCCKDLDVTVTVTVTF